jgi:hypothetical protein
MRNGTWSKLFYRNQGVASSDAGSARICLVRCRVGSMQARDGFAIMAGLFWDCGEAALREAFHARGNSGKESPKTDRETVPEPGAT